MNPSQKSAPRVPAPFSSRQAVPTSPVVRALADAAVWALAPPAIASQAASPAASGAPAVRGRIASIRGRPPRACPPGTVLNGVFPDIEAPFRLKVPSEERHFGVKVPGPDGA